MSQSDAYAVSLARSQVEQAAAVLARTFQYAPDMRFLVGNDAQMLDNKALRFYKAVIMAGLLYGEVFTTPSLEGVAVWISPESSSFTFGSLFRTGLLKAILLMGPGPMLRFVRSSSYVQKLQEQAISVPRWVLVFLGVEPSQQGKGIGGKLIQPILTRADSADVPCYVESADERNLSFYKKHGFVIINQGQVPNGGPQVWVLVKEPVSNIEQTKH